uniref:DNA-directed RNA polymerase n=1 Tax=Astrephomene gubernaculifera TaxID=47775 RepID=A0A7R6ULH7_9CHLO|nr:RNA polymerase beta subunit II [Astrephomene gubernaculifera]
MLNINKFHDATDVASMAFKGHDTVISYQKYFGNLFYKQSQNPKFKKPASPASNDNKLIISKVILQTKSSGLLDWRTPFRDPYYIPLKKTKKEQKTKKTLLENSYLYSEKSLPTNKIKYNLEAFQRSNQDTCLIQKPVVKEGDWIETGDLLADSAASVGGELAIGHNIIVAYMPWEGYNYEDAILINERLVYEDIYTSIHIERYEVLTKDTKLGPEQITRNIPDTTEDEISHLDKNGIAKIGSWIEEGDILVGKITPFNIKTLTPQQKLLFKIFDKELSPTKDSSLRAPKGIKANVININILDKIFPNHKKKVVSTQVPSLSTAIKAINKRLYKLKKKVAALNTMKKSLRGNCVQSLNRGGNICIPFVFMNNVATLLPQATFMTKKTGLQPFCYKSWLGLVPKKQVAAIKPNYKWQTKKTELCLSAQSALHPLGCRRFGEAQSADEKNRNRIKKYNKEVWNAMYLPCYDVAFHTLFVAEGEHLSGGEYFFRRQTNGPRKKKKQQLLPKKQTRWIIKGENWKLLNTTNNATCKANNTNKKVLGQWLYFTKSNSRQLPAWMMRRLIITNSSLTSKTQQKNNLLTSVKTKKQVTPHLKGDPTKDNNKVDKKEKVLKNKKEKNKKPAQNVKSGNNFPQIKNVHIYLAEKRKIQVGDKMAGRHGNKGIVSRILPRQDMPFLPDGTSVDIVLNPLGVPSRMNVGQIYECLLGLAGRYLGEHYKIPPFDEVYGADASRSFVLSKLYEARKKTGINWLFDPNNPGKIRLFDGRNSECFDQTVTVGVAYVLKLIHMVDDKMHCMTSDHDVLTHEGWLPINEITIQHNVATLNRNTGELVYQRPTEVFQYHDYKGSLYHIKNTNLDLLTTLNHRMLVRDGLISGDPCLNYELIQAKDILGKHYKYLKTAYWHKKDYQFILPSIIANSCFIPEKHINMDAWLTFFGLWIAKGCVTSNKNKSQNNSVYQVQVAKNKQSVKTILENAVKTLGYNYRIVDDNFIIDGNSVHDKQLWSYLNTLSLGTPNKKLPDWVWVLSQKQAQLFLHSMCLGYNTSRLTSMSYYTTSTKLANDVMRLALHAGWSANQYLYIPKGTVSQISGRNIRSNYDVWRLCIIKSQNNPTVNDGRFVKQNIQKEEILSYEGSIYCLSVPNEVFYVRRNGLPVWTGNSRSTGPYSLVTQQPLRGRSKQGGQRLGEMEVWAIEGYGAAFVLSEMLTIKSDDMIGRQNLWKNLIENNDISFGSPESFKVLVCELQALCLDIGLFRKPNNLSSNKTTRTSETQWNMLSSKTITSMDNKKANLFGLNQQNQLINKQSITPNLIEIDNLLHLA